MNKQAFFTLLYNRLVELNVSSENISKYIKQFERYFNTMTDGEAEEHIKTLDGVEGIARNIVSLIKKREQSDKEIVSASSDTREHSVIEIRKTEEISARNLDDTKVIDAVHIGSENEYEDAAATEDIDIEAPDEEYYEYDDEPAEDGDVFDAGITDTEDSFELPDDVFDDFDESYSETENDDEADIDENLDEDNLEYEQILLLKNKRARKEPEEAMPRGANKFRPARTLDMSGGKPNSDGASALVEKEEDDYTVDPADEANEIVRKGGRTSDFKRKASRMIERRDLDDTKDYESDVSVNIDKLDETYYDDIPIPNTVLFWSVFAISLPVTLPVLTVVFSLFAAAFVSCAALIVALVVSIVAIVIAGTGVSLVGIIYGVTQTFEALPIGLFEIGFGIIIAGCSMLAGILIYNLAVRLLPFVMRYLTILFKFTLRKIRGLFRLAKRECAKRS